MRRIAKVAYQVRDFVDERAARVRLGEPLDLRVEVDRLRVVIALLESVGLVQEVDWRLPEGVVGSRGAAIDRLRGELPFLLSARIAVMTDVDDVVARVLASYLSDIASLVVEMACYMYAYDTAMGCVTLSSSRRRRRSARPRLTPKSISHALLHADPEGFLADAEARLAVVKEEVARARRRIAYLADEAGSEGVRFLPPPVSLHGASSASLVSKATGAVGDLFVGGKAAAKGRGPRGRETK